jgi:hypothetical protein
MAGPVRTLPEGITLALILRQRSIYLMSGIGRKAAYKKTKLIVFLWEFPYIRMAGSPVAHSMRYAVRDQ